MMQLIQMAFRTQGHRILYGPESLNTARFDVVAKGKTDATRPETMEMLQSLLADRFKLKFHNDTRELPIYELEVTKGGSKLKEIDLAECNRTRVEPPPGQYTSQCGAPTLLGDAQRGAILSRALPVGVF